MVDVKKEGVILSKTALSFENEAVLNPGVMQDGNTVHMFYRAVQKGNISSIGYCKIEGPLTIKQRFTKPVLECESDYESRGLEDPRVVKIDDLYYLTYSAFDGENALGALATSEDLKKFVKGGLIVPKVSKSDFNNYVTSNGKLTKRYSSMNSGEGFLMNKDVVFFPRRINGKLCFLHRVRPEIQFVSVNELSELTKEFWDDYFVHFDKNVLMAPRYSQESSYIGAGCPPIETEHGWLMIYHGVEDTSDGHIYSARAALLDLDDPKKEISRLPYKLFKPDNDYELAGIVDKVCFPTGTALFDDILYIYYGAADEQIACSSLSLSELIEELLQYKSG